MELSTKNFNYDLPEELIAQKPAEKRIGSKLMHLSRVNGQVSHHHFPDILEMLRPGDLLVANNTRVIPAKFFCKRKSGANIEGLFVRYLADDSWEVMLKNAVRCKDGEIIDFVNDESQGLQLCERLGGGRWKVSPSPQGKAEDILDKLGKTPLPPYIRREKESPDAEDRQRYQTVFAKTPGAVAAPTAGLHFTDEMLEKIEALGVKRANVTLHVGLGTFLPVKVEDFKQHDMHSEYYELSAETIDAIEQTKKNGGRVIAVGTTTVRVLESVAKRFKGKLEPCYGETKLFLYPPCDFHIVDALLTNFHLPQSTLLMLVSAFVSPNSMAGIETTLNAYAQAVAEKYRFFSYGDAMFID